MGEVTGTGVPSCDAVMRVCVHSACRLRAWVRAKCDKEDNMFACVQLYALVIQVSCHICDIL